MPEAVNKLVPPYLPFKTFLSSLDTLSHGVPPKIDRSLWRSQSGVTQGLIMHAYRFLYLVDEEESDAATEHLEKMAKNPDQRPALLRERLNAHYHEILDNPEIDITKMSMKMLDSEFEQSYAVSGATKQKAITFFLKAAKYADVPLSPYLLNQIRNSGPRKKRGIKGKGAPLAPGETNGTTIAPVMPSTAGAETHSVRLVSGGTVTISVSFNPFRMPTEDRDFVFGLIDKIQEYEESHPLVSSDGEELEDED
ncbi:MAG: hypothetical protein ACM3JB_13685 [Acidobacteriaceae bacterium]